MIRLFAFIFMMSLSVYGRSPAVEPITGLSIDRSYKVEKVLPGQFFNFQDEKTSPRPHIKTKALQGTIPSAADIRQKAQDTSTLYLLFLLALFPLFLRTILTFIYHNTQDEIDSEFEQIKQKLEKDDANANQDNVVYLSEQRKDTKDDDEDDQKKAS